MASPSAVKPLSPAALWAHPPRGRALQADGCEIYSPLVISDAGLRNTLRMLKAPHRAPPAVTALGQSISYLSLFVGLRGQTDPLPWPWGGGGYSLSPGNCPPGMCVSPIFMDFWESFVGFPGQPALLCLLSMVSLGPVVLKSSASGSPLISTAKGPTLPSTPLTEPDDPSWRHEMEPG